MVAGLVVAVLVGWGVGAGLAIKSIRADAREAGRDLAAMSEGLDPISADLDELQADLGEVGDQLDRAGDRAASVWLLPARLVPGISRQMSSVSHLADSGHIAAVAISDLVGEVIEARDALEAKEPARGVLGGLGERFAATSRQLASLDLGPGAGLLSFLADARDELATNLNDAREDLERATEVAAGLARFFSPGRYLLLALNPSEMRVGMGMVLQVGVLDVAEDGSVVLDRIQAVHGFQPPVGTVAIADEDLARNWGWLHPEWLWQNIALTPRFPVVAAQAVTIWEQVGDGPVEGVIALDSVAVASLVGSVGPIEVDGVEFDGPTARSYLGNGQYFADDVGKGRRESLGELAAAAFTRITDRGLGDLDVARSLVDAGRGRHLMLWSNDPVEQQAWVDLGLDGDLGPHDLQVSLSNHSANKLDWFMEMQGDLGVRSLPDAHHVRVELAMSNGVVAADQPRYVIGGVTEPPGTYVGIATFALPGDARDIVIEGIAQQIPPALAGQRFELLDERDAQSAIVRGRDGVSFIIAVPVVVEPGATITRVVTFELPLAHDELRIIPSGRWSPIPWTGLGNADREIALGLGNPG